MVTEAQNFYSLSSPKSITQQDVLTGRVIKINPALITITDGLIGAIPPESLQQMVWGQVVQLLQHKIRTFHVDLNFADYGGFGPKKPDINSYIFSPSFLESLNNLIRSYNGFLNLHLLTDFPHRHLYEFEHIALGAVCFQLEVIVGPKQLQELVDHILELGVCASPVIETVGSENFKPTPPREIFTFLEPALSKIGMLTLQAAGTASRSNIAPGTFAKEQVAPYIEWAKRSFSGAIQIQGGITTNTIQEAVRMGAEFLVSGTQIFRNQEGLTAPEVIDIMLGEASKALIK